jgi:hypothetical protein
MPERTEEEKQQIKLGRQIWNSKACHDFVHREMAQYLLGFTEEYQNRNWRQCRHGKDLRNCGTWKGSTFVSGYFSKKENGEFVIYCVCDKKVCDAHWVGDKE